MSGLFTKKGGTLHNAGKAARLAMICILLHGLIFALLHFTEPQLGPLGSIISDYAQTPSSWLAKISLFAFAVAWLALGIALRTTHGNRLVRVGRILLIMAFVAILAGIAFPESMDPRTGSLLAKIQNLISRPGLFLGVLLVSTGLGRLSGWKIVAPKLLALSIAAFVLLVFTIVYLLPSGLGGLGQRLVFLLLYVWVWLVASRLLVSPAGD
jgi:hypothetical protein